MNAVAKSNNINLWSRLQTLKLTFFGREKRRVKGLTVYQQKQHIYLNFQAGSKKIRGFSQAISDDGLHFSLTKQNITTDDEDKAVGKFLSSYRSLQQTITDMLSSRVSSSGSGALNSEFLVKLEEGDLLAYDSIVAGRRVVGLCLSDAQNSHQITWQSPTPIWSEPEEWRGKRAVCLGGGCLHNRILAYWQLEDKEIFVVIYGEYSPARAQKSSPSLHLQRSPANPLIVPNSQNSWEAFTTFNPAAIYDDGKVHILYRAQGYDYISRIGYASSSDGVHIDERLSEPIYTSSTYDTGVLGTPTEVSMQYISGGGYGGCEDPRITRIDNRYYMTYVEFDGVNPPRIALTSIDASHFLHQRWFWERPVLISPPGIVDKSAVIFPRKIGGKYVIMHRIYPDILIDYVDSLDFDGTFWLKGEYKISPRPNHWDSRKIGAGAPPIETEAGWLLIYQSVDEKDPGRYKVGAMLLDLETPHKVLHRSATPILEPQASYENDGFKSGVIYPCGAVVMNGTLFVYYGGADSCVCAATATLTDFLHELTSTQEITINRPQMDNLLT